MSSFITLIDNEDDYEEAMQELNYYMSLERPSDLDISITEVLAIIIEIYERDNVSDWLL